MIYLKRLFQYLLDKRSEAKDLDYKDALLAKVVLDIHRKRTHKSIEMVPLFSVKPIHPLDRDNAMQKVQERINALQSNKDNLLQQKNLNATTLTETIPSISAIKTVKLGSNKLIAFEGNGRLGALQAVFTETDNMHIEVEQYHFNDMKK